MAYFEMAREAFTNLFKKPVCRMYPLKAPEYPAGARGHLASAIDGCIFCGLCQKKCPTSAITVDRKARTWQLETLRCIACGSCSEACPKQCLELLPDYGPALAAGQQLDAVQVLKAGETVAPDVAA